MVDSIVIVKNEFGYTAYLRFEDSRNDQDIASINKDVLYGRIEKAVNWVQGWVS